MLDVSIVGASGYTGGELLRLLSFHPEVRVVQATSERFAGKQVARVHPNLRGVTKLKFCSMEALSPCDLLFLCLPHGETARAWPRLQSLAPKHIDLSADFRLNDEHTYRRYYGNDHLQPQLLGHFVYGLPELHRERIRFADRIACGGCNATVTILALMPLFHQGLVANDHTVVEVKVGSSEGGNRSSDASHHPIRSGCLRSFRPTGHRHTAEIEQALGNNHASRIHFSATAVDMVRGALATCHVFPEKSLTEKAVWSLYREAYGVEPFIRIVKERDGHYRYPEPKLLAGTNYCDIGFEWDPDRGRLVVIAAIDNLVKGSAGQAVQCMNLTCGFEERLGLTFPGLHPV